MDSRLFSHSESRSRQEHRTYSWAVGQLRCTVAKCTYQTSPCNFLGYLEAIYQDKFFAELLLIVKRVKRFETKMDEGWYSEGEMKTELSWSPPVPLVFRSLHSPSLTCLQDAP